jgi:RIO kinase 1
VRVPQPYDCVNGVLLMELVVDKNGDVAPRLAEVTMSSEQAIIDHAVMMINITRMLCAGLVHGDLSEFNVLMDEYGPVIIDLPQAVDAAANNNAKAMLKRDIDNMTRYYSQYAPELTQTNYVDEIWALYENGELTPDTVLSGQYKKDTHDADVDGVMHEINSILADEERRQERLRELESED